MPNPGDTVLGQHIGKAARCRYVWVLCQGPCGEGRYVGSKGQFQVMPKLCKAVLPGGAEDRGKPDGVGGCMSTLKDTDKQPPIVSVPDPLRNHYKALTLEQAKKDAEEYKTFYRGMLELSEYRDYLEPPNPKGSNSKNPWCPACGEKW